MNVKRLAVILTLTLAFGPGCRNKQQQPVAIIMTPDVAESGLLQALTSVFQRHNGVSIDLRTASREEAVKKASAHEIQLVFARKSAIQSFGSLRRLSGEIASRDIVLFGPHRDPARVAGAKDLRAALERIKKRNARFCTPVDVPYLKDLEQSAWSRAGIDPASVRRREDCHGTEAEVLQQADQRDAYVFASAHAASSGIKLDIHPIRVDDQELHDEIWFVLIDHEPRIRRDKDAEWLAQWLMSYEGREFIQNYRVAGIQQFSVRDSQGR